MDRHCYTGQQLESHMWWQQQARVCSSLRQPRPTCCPFIIRLGGSSSLRVGSQKLSHRRQARAPLKFQTAEHAGGPPDIPPQEARALPGSECQLMLMVGERSLSFKQKLTKQARLVAQPGTKHLGGKANGREVQFSMKTRLPSENPISNIKTTK